MINWFRKKRRERQEKAEAQHRRDQLRRRAGIHPAPQDAPFASLLPDDPDDGVAIRFATALIEQAERESEQAEPVSIYRGRESVTRPDPVDDWAVRLTPTESSGHHHGSSHRAEPSSSPSPSESYSHHHDSSHSHSSYDSSSYDSGSSYSSSDSGGGGGW